MEKTGANKSVQNQSTEPPVGLFDRIIIAIKKEQESEHTKKTLIIFLALLVISCFAAPFSSLMFFNQVKNSGIVSFLSMIPTDFFLVLSSWREFGSALLESVPIVGIAIFTLNIILTLFAIRLFLHKKQFLLKYLIHSLINKKLIV